MCRRVLFVIAASIVLNSFTHAADGAAAPVVEAPEIAPEVKTESKPETKPEVKPEAKTEAKPEVKAESKPEAKVEAKPEVMPEPKPAAKPEPLSEEKSASEAAGLRPVPSKDRTLVAPEPKHVEPPLNACAAKLKPVADAYTKAHDDILVWLREASEKLDAAEEKVGGLKKQIAEKEAQITQLKLESSRKNDAQMRVLDQESRALWSQLKTEESKRKDLCRALAVATGQKVRDLNRGVLDQLEKSSDEATGR